MSTHKEAIQIKTHIGNEWRNPKLLNLLLEMLIAWLIPFSGSTAEISEVSTASFSGSVTGKC